MLWFSNKHPVMRVCVLIACSCKEEFNIIDGLKVDLIALFLYIIKNLLIK